MAYFKGAGRLAALAAGAGLMCLASVATAPASGLHDHVYSDSYGNLIVMSPAGYKRIVVGRGYLARRMAANNAHHRVKIVHPRPAFDGAVECIGHAALLRGRSHMYGLPAGVVPTPADACR